MSKKDLSTAADKLPSIDKTPADFLQRTILKPDIDRRNRMVIKRPLHATNPIVMAGASGTWFVQHLNNKGFIQPSGFVTGELSQHYSFLRKELGIVHLITRPFRAARKTTFERTGRFVRVNRRRR